MREAALLAPDEPVLVMVSGGRDSVCLLDLAVRICGAARVHAVHVNYGLRDGAGADEQLCASLCERLGVELSVRRPSSAPSGNVQAWARDLRYAAAHELAGVLDRGTESMAIAAAHTASDQVETILYRLASSPSRRAVLGMRARTGRLIRPLLGTTREETTAYCAARSLSFRDDPTNAQDTYARGRIRNDLVPALRSVHPAAEENLLSLAALLHEEADALDQIVEGVLAGDRGGEEAGAGVIEGAAIELSRLRALPLALARLVLQRLADQAAGRPAPGTARRAEEILGLPDHAELDLPHGVRAHVRRGTLTFSARS